MLRQSLRNLPPRNGRLADPGELLARAGLEETRRPEEIEVAGFVALTQAWVTLTDEHEGAPAP